MGHVPHVYLPSPWPQVSSKGSLLSLSEEQTRHLRKVLRLRDGAPISYTDGQGTSGTGVLEADGVRRGEEKHEPSPRPRITLAVAPPARSERCRYVVEKLGELGVDRLVWLHTRRGEGKPPRPDRQEAWAQAALQQSRGSRLLENGGADELANLVGTLWVADRRGSAPPPVVDGVIIAVGPEGGFEENEIPAHACAVGLGRQVLRVETAAVVVATLALLQGGRLQ